MQMHMLLGQGCSVLLLVIYFPTGSKHLRSPEAGPCVRTYTSVPCNLGFNNPYNELKLTAPP